MITRPLSYGRYRLPDNWISSVFRLLVVRIQVTVCHSPYLAYQLESLFMDYHEDLLELKIRARFHLKPLRHIQ